MPSDPANELSRSLVPPDRRRRYRARVHWPVEFERTDGLDFRGTETQDLSSDGFYCRSKVVFTEGDVVSCTLEVPTHRRQASGETLRVRCRVRIVRVDEPDSQGFRGLACRIEEYHFPSVEPPTV
ncbi:MAG: PilZ domain-containing protein [Bryobacteraceae bacterium]